ncbi:MULTISPECIES: benzoate-CoA ligase family protein [Myxococcaceae]|uniref:acyl-CoA synthetase n=1 Tax=Myxococcaceae TaxID=31 RepID=UPI00188DD3D0|nr:benzoate-CoA ligase family protein [Simulacricoccus sp. 17bor-14]
MDPTPAALDWRHLPERLNLAELFLHRQLPARGDAPALLTETETLTYAQLADQVDRACAVFRALGLQPEQRVLLMLPDVPAFASAWLGCVKAGGVVGAVSPDLKPEEVRYYLEYTGATLLVAHASVLPLVEAALPHCPRLRRVLVVGSGEAGAGAGAHVAYERALAEATPDPHFHPTHRDDAAVWLFTSGSTGFPKGAVHKAHDFLYNALTYGLPILGYRPGDVMLSVPKLAFGYALGTNLLFPLLAGAASVLFPEKPTPERLCALVRRFRPTLLTAVPTALNQLASAPEAEGTDFSCLRLCVSAGEALPAELYHRFRARTGVEVLDGIGSAEMFHIFITNRPGDVKLGALGRVVEGYEARVCDDEGHELPRGEVGTLWVRGDSMALEYWREHEKSKHTFRGDWCVSADKFRQDEEGYFYFCGRGDDLLKVSGKWLAPVEVENALLSHPAVREAAVVGFKDHDGLDKPRAFVALQPGHAGSPELAEALKAHVRAQLAAYKAPREVRFVEALPRSERGKVLKGELRA